MPRPITSTLERTREARLRRKADRQSLRLIKSNRRDLDALDYGLYALIDVQTSTTVHPRNLIGTPFALNLDEVEMYLTDDE